MQTLLKIYILEHVSQLSKGKPPVMELLDVERSHQCYEMLKDGKDIKSLQELHPGDFLAVRINRSSLYVVELHDSG